MSDKTQYTHDCTACTFLGQTIGGGHITDLYAHQNKDHVTLIARYGDEGHEYLSTWLQYARPSGHSELWAARELYVRRGDNVV